MTAGEAKGDSVAGDVIVSFVDELLKQEADQQTSLEGRGLAVITTSGALVTLLFGLSAVVTKGTGFALTAGQSDQLTIAVAAFVLAAILAIVTNAPLLRSRVKTDVLAPLVEPEFWGYPASDARAAIAPAKLKLLKGARRANDWKGATLLAGITSEIVGVVYVALAVSSILAG